MASRTEGILLKAPVIGLALLAGAWLLPGAQTPSVQQAMGALPPPPEKPEQGIAVTDTESLQRWLAEAPAESTLLLAPGEYQGPILIERGLQVWGPAEAVIHTNGEGTTVHIQGDGAAALGFSIEGSGTRYDLLDAAVGIEGDDHLIEGLRIRGAVYGIIANQCKNLRLIGNEVIGTGQEAMGLRGDGIRIWETYESEVRDNHMSGARDMVIWYSSNNLIAGNEVRNCRYGTHLMYSHDNEVRDNLYVGNVVGLFSMYTRSLTLRNNIFAASSGSAGIGLGMKESSDLQVEGNIFIGNERGMYFDNSPFEPGTRIEVVGNDFFFSSVALDFHDSPEAVVLRDNLFRANWSLISVAGRGDALGMTTEGNDYDRYRGYDLDQDQIGDVPFEERSMSEQLISEEESLALFRGTPASGTLEAIGKLLPLYRPKALLKDESPAMGIRSPLEIPR